MQTRVSASGYNGIDPVRTAVLHCVTMEIAKAVNKQTGDDEHNTQTQAHKSSSNSGPRDEDKDTYNWKDEHEDGADTRRALRDQVRKLDKEMVAVRDLKEKL